jgi:hypothetical protein
MSALVAIFGVLSIPVGFIAFIVMIVLAATKNRQWKRWLITWLSSIAVFIICFSIDLPSDNESDYVSVESIETSIVESHTFKESQPLTEESTVTTTKPDTETTSITTEQTITEQTEDLIDTSVTFADIYRDREANKLVADEKYNGNRYRITAKINGMSTGGLLNLTGGATLTMEVKVDNTIVFFLAEFEREQEDALKKIVVGDTITFDGVCYGGSFTDCEMVED